MEKTTIDCEDCGQKTEVNRSNAKYCVVCRLTKFVGWAATRTHQCWKCDKKFAPLRRGDVLCGGCDRHYASDINETCGFCHQASGQIIDDLVRVCRPCATDPKNRQAFAKALYKKQEARINE